MPDDAVVADVCGGRHFRLSVWLLATTLTLLALFGGLLMGDRSILAEDLRASEARIRVVETQNAAANERLRNIETLLVEIRRDVRKAAERPGDQP